MSVLWTVLPLNDFDSHFLSKSQVCPPSTTTEVLIEKRKLACKKFNIMNLNRMLYAGFGLHKVIHDGNIITTLTISLVWIFYSLIPPYLLVHYHFIGKGQTLRWASKLCYMLSFFCSVAAIILIWLVYPRGVRTSALYSPLASIARKRLRRERWRSPQPSLLALKEQCATVILFACNLCSSCSLLARSWASVSVKINGLTSSVFWLAH